MLVVRDTIIAFRRDGALILFDSRADFEATDIEAAGINLLFASPSDLYRRLVELEEENEKGDGIQDGEEAEREQVGEKWLVAESENAVRAIKAREDGKQRKWGVGG